MEYQKLRPLTGQKPARSTGSPESLYWRQFKAPVFVKEFAPINSINFVPQATYAAPKEVNDPSSSSSATSAAGKQKFAVTSATRVQIYSMRNDKVTRTISRFSDVARCGSFRSDGKLLVAGDDSGLIQVFDASSRSILRTLKGHDLPVHVSRFSSTPTQILSASDDRTVRLWDLPEEKEIRIFNSHTDYVRSAIVSPDNPSLLLSGSYDGTVKLWDARMAENDGCAINMRHGAPVEDVLIFPTGGGGVALSAGGPVLRSWDLMMAGRCTNAVSNHSKTITSLSLSMSSGADATAASGLGGIRVLSAGLDHLVKVYDPAKDYKVVHTMRYPAPILCLAVSPDESHIAAGMADGTLCIRKRQLRASELQHRQEQNRSSYEYFVGQQQQQQQLSSQTGIPQQDEMRVESVRRQRLQPYDKMLKKFQHSDALDAVLRKDIAPSVTFALLAELRDRSSADGSLDGLRRAIEGRDDVTLEPLLRFLLRQSSNPSYTSLVSDCLNVIIDLYAPVLGQSPLIDELFGRIWSKVTDELKLQRNLVEVKGSLEMLMTRSAMG